MTYRYEVNLFQNGRKTYSEVKELSAEHLMIHTGRAGKEAFLGLVNTWNRQGMIGFDTHGRTYVYVAIT